MGKIRVAVRVDAGNDRNGNPRRGWLIVDAKGDTVEFIDEGYSGDRELEKKFGIKQGLERCTIELNITPGCYRALLKQQVRL